MPITATHGASITRLAVTDDGRAAVSADQHGGIRLWPALDGSREPIVVAAADPAALAIAHEGNEYVIAVHDSAHGVELIRVSAKGEVRSRVTLDAEPEILQVELTVAGALLLRADRAIDLVDPAGVPRSHLVPTPGTRVRSIVTRAGRALAITDADNDVRARWIVIEGGRAHWGETSALLPIDAAGPIALSPDHATLVATKPGPGVAPMLVDLATGRIVKQRICGAAPELTALGFLDATTVACSAASQVTWWTAAGEPITPKRPDPITTTGAALAIGGGVLIGGVGHQLGIYTPGAQKFLGYGFRELTNVRPTQTGLMIGKGDQQPLLLDAAFHERARFALPKQEAAWTDLYPLDDRFVITVATRLTSTDKWGNGYQVSVFDAVTRTVHQVLPNHAASPEIAFEPATQLLLSSEGLTRLLFRYDPVAHSFTDRIELVDEATLKRVYLLDPALADGVVAIGVREVAGGVVLDEFHGDDIRDGRLPVRTSYRLRGTLDAVDRAGHVVIHAYDYAVYRHGIRGIALPDLRMRTLRPSADGRTLAAFGEGQIDLLSLATGRTSWQTAAWGATDVMWTPNGELAARFPGALAKLDVSTGELGGRQCGWSFGIADAPFETSASTPIVCDVAR